MKVHLRVDGGFAALPGLSRPYCVDVDALPPDERAAWHATVAATAFFERSAPRPAASFPDARRVVVTVDDGERSRTLTFDDPPCDAAVAALVRRLRERQAAARRGAA